MAGLFALGSAATFGLPTESDEQRVSVAAPEADVPSTAHKHDATGAVMIPGVSTNGVLEIAVPPGTAEAIASGREGYILPAVIRLAVGDRIVIRNDDVSAHIVLFAFVRPGETVERTLTDTGSETYSAGCAAMQTANGFTTMFVGASRG